MSQPRVVILDGEPGTGKTRMIRAMINEVSEATTILVPSQMAGKLGEPGFLNVLIDNTRSSSSSRTPTPAWHRARPTTSRTSARC